MKHEYGLTQFIHQKDNENEWVGRIIKQTNHTFTVATRDEIIEHVQQQLTKKEKKKNSVQQKYVVGDFVSLEMIEEHLYIKEVYPRKNVLSKAHTQAKKDLHGKVTEQLVAANVDQLFIVIATDQRFTLSKLERYMLTFAQENMEQIVLITKSDYKEQATYLEKQILAAHPDLTIQQVSAFEEESVQQFKQTLKEGGTALLIGSSGSGKSTLINQLVGEDKERTNEVRVDGKGKHTTTYSTLIPIKGTKSSIIDTPGIKSIATTKKTNQAALFKDIEEIAVGCKFRDCRHDSEPKCAVKAAVRNGELAKERLERFRKVNG